MCTPFLIFSLIWSGYERRRRLIITGMLACVVVGCSNSPLTFKYHGDGTFVDRGPSSGSMRYVLTLGKLNTGMKESLTFKTGPLPRVKFHWGFRIEDNVPELDSSNLEPIVSQDMGTVALTIYDRENNTLLVQNYGPLDKESWTFNLGHHDPFAYNDTSFVPYSGKGYMVIAEVVEPGSKEVTLTVEAFGGGWQ